MTVLVVKDDRFVLAEQGGTPDLLHVDIVLPGSNGLDFARAAKAASPALIFPVPHKPFSSDGLLGKL